MDTTFPNDFPGPKKGDCKERPKNHSLFSGGQFKYPLGVVLSISGVGVIIWWAF